MPEQSIGNGLKLPETNNYNAPHRLCIVCPLRSMTLTGRGLRLSALGSQLARMNQLALIHTNIVDLGVQIENSAHAAAYLQARSLSSMLDFNETGTAQRSSFNLTSVSGTRVRCRSRPMDKSCMK